MQALHTATRLFAPPPEPAPVHPAQWWTVEDDPSGTFRKGAQFTHQDITNRKWGMVVYGCFADGTLLVAPDGARWQVHGRHLDEIKDEEEKEEEVQNV